MLLSDFDQLLSAAHQQPDPQRLLFVFVRAELPEAATEEQRERHAGRVGGTLTPVLCVDKLPGEIAGFAALASESAATGQPWDLVFVAAMGGRDGHAPSTEAAEPHLRGMLQAIGLGQVSRYAAFDMQGNPVQFY